MWIVSIVCAIFIIVILYSMCGKEGYERRVQVQNTYLEQHEFEKMVSVNQPAIFFKAPLGRTISFDAVKVECPAGMAAYGDDSSVRLYDAKYNILPLFTEKNGGDDFFVIVPVKKILDEITCLNGSVNTAASVKVSGRYHLV
jgi:hypothetical protein